MSNIEVGDYVRTNLGNIGKIVKEYTFKNGQVEYPEPQEWVLDNGYVLNEAMMFSNKEEIVKHSKNIIDLIEVGDYVNGYPVASMYGCTGVCLNINYQKHGISQIVEIQDIKSIVTWEMMKSVEYRVE